MSSTSGTRGTPPLDRQDRISPLSGAVDVLLRFGALMLRSGNTAARTREWIELMVAELEQLAKTVEPGQTPRDIAARLAAIETTPPRYSSVQIAAAVGLASGGFAFLNGAAVVEMIASAIGGGIGQWSRSWMARRGLSQYGAAALCAVVASGVYVLASTMARHTGFEFAHYPAGFIASVLFLSPGFP